MKNVLVCRRTFIAVISITALLVLGWRGMDVSTSIAVIAVGLAGANAGEAAMKTKFQTREGAINV